ncbi:MAG: PqqD family protein [Bacteroidetes bacterium]|nr:PqqD family protein [Bacteroidota bacterium]
MIDIKALAEKKKNFASRQVGEELILVPLKDNVAEMNEMFTLNEVGCFIWENMDENKTMEDIENAIRLEFDGEDQEIQAGLAEFLEKLSGYILKY